MAVSVRRRLGLAARAPLALCALLVTVHTAWGSAVTDIAGPGCTENFAKKPECVGDPAQNRMRLWLHADDIQGDPNATNDVEDEYTNPTQAALAFTTGHIVVRWPDRSGFGNDAVPVGNSALRVVTSATKTAMGAVMVPRVQRYFPGGADCGVPLVGDPMVRFGRPGEGCPDMALPADLIDRASASAPAINPPAWAPNSDGILLRFPISGVTFASVPPLATQLAPPPPQNTTATAFIPGDFQYRCTIESGIGHACDVMVTEQSLTAARSSVPDVEVFMVARMYDPNARQTLFNLAMPSDGGFTNAGDFRVRLSSDYEYETSHRPSPGRAFSRRLGDDPVQGEVTQQRANKLWFIAAPGTQVEGDTCNADTPPSCVVKDQLDPPNGAALGVEIGADYRAFARDSIYSPNSVDPNSIQFYVWVDRASTDLSNPERRILTQFPQVWNFSSSVSRRKQSIALNGTVLATDDSGGHALYMPENHVASWGWGFSPDGNSPSVQMKLHEFMVFFAPLNDAERAMMNAALALEWGLVLPPHSLQFFYRKPRNTSSGLNTSTVCNAINGARDLRGHDGYGTLFCASPQAFRWAGLRQLFSERLGGIGRMPVPTGGRVAESIEIGSSGPLTLSSPARNGFLDSAGKNSNAFKFILVVHGESNTVTVPMRYRNYRTGLDVDEDTLLPFDLRRALDLPGPDSVGAPGRSYGMNESGKECGVIGAGANAVPKPITDGFTSKYTCWDVSPSLVEQGVYPKITWLVSTVNVDDKVTVGPPMSNPPLPDRDDEDNDLVTFTFRLADMGYNKEVRQRGALPRRTDGADSEPGVSEAWDPWPTYDFNYRLSFSEHFAELYRDYYVGSTWQDFHEAVNICRLGIRKGLSSDKAKCKPTGQCADIDGVDPATEYNVLYPQDLEETFIGMPIQHGVYKPGKPTIGPTASNDENRNGIHDGAEDDTVSFTLDAGHFATRSTEPGDVPNLHCDGMHKFTLRIHDLVDPIHDLGRSNTRVEIRNRYVGTEGLWLGPTLRCCPLVGESAVQDGGKIREGEGKEFRLVMYPRPQIRWDFLHETVLRVDLDIAPGEVDLPAEEPAYRLQNSIERLISDSTAFQLDPPAYVRSSSYPDNTDARHMISSVDVHITGRGPRASFSEPLWGCNESPAYVGSGGTVSGNAKLYSPKSQSLDDQSPYTTSVDPQYTAYDDGDPRFRFAGPFRDGNDRFVDRVNENLVHQGNYAGQPDAGDPGYSGELGCEGLFYIHNLDNDIYTGSRFLTLSVRGTSLTYVVELQDDELPPVIFVSQASTEVAEQAPGLMSIGELSNEGRITFTLRVQEGSTQTTTASRPITINLAALPPPATTAEGSKYVLDAQVVIESGQSSATAVLRTNDDGDTDGDKTLNIGFILGARQSGIELSSNSPSSATFIIRDNEAPGLRVAPDEFVFTESSEPIFLNVSLESRPSEPILVSLRTHDADTATLDIASITFTRLNWSAIQRVEVSPEFDPRLRDRQTTLTVSIDRGSFAPDSTNPFIQVPDRDLSVQVINANLAGFSVSSPTLVLSESGEEALVAVALTARPNEDWNENVVLFVSVVEGDRPGIGCEEVEIFIATPAQSLNAGGCEAGDRLMLTFSPDEWDVSQDVRIVAQDDDVDRSDSAVVSIGYDGVASTFSGVGRTVHSFNSLQGSIQDIQVTLVNEDVAQVVLHRTDPGNNAITEPGTGAVQRIEIDEAGGGAIGFFNVQLGTRPEGSVRIDVTEGDTATLVARDSPARYRVEPETWDAKQQINIQGVDDDGGADRTATLILSTAQSEDAVYQNALPLEIEVTVLTDERPGLLVNTTALTVAEPSVGRVPQRGTISVALASLPTGPVSVEVVSEDPDEVSVSLTGTQLITPENWDQGFSFTVFGVNDDTKGNDQGIVEIAIDAGDTDDRLYEMVTQATTVLVTVTDNEQAGFLVFDESDEIFDLAVTESNMKELGVRLQVPPDEGIASVSATISVRDELAPQAELLLAEGHGHVAPCAPSNSFSSAITVSVTSTQTFTPFTLCAVDDGWLRPDSVTLRLESLTLGYEVEPPKTLPVRIVDNERAEVSFVHLVDVENFVLGSSVTATAPLVVFESAAMTTSVSFAVVLAAPAPNNDYALFELSACATPVDECSDKNRLSLGDPLYMPYPTTTAVATISSIDNRIIEASEEVNLQLFTLVSAAYPTTLTHATSATVRIENDDVAGFTFSSSASVTNAAMTVRVAEGASVSYELTLLSCPVHGDALTEVVVRPMLRGTAGIHDGGLTLRDGSGGIIGANGLVFDCDDAGQPVSVVVDANDDNLFQDRSTAATAYRIVHTLESASLAYNDNVRISTVTVQVTDDNDQGLVFLNLAASADGALRTLAENDMGDGLIFTVQQTARSSAPAAITLYDASEQGAQYGEDEDYVFILDGAILTFDTQQPPRPIVTIPAFALSVAVTVRPVDDAVYETDELVTIRALAAGGNSQLSPVLEETQIRFEIEDDETAPTVSLRLTADNLRDSFIPTIGNDLVRIDALPERGPLDSPSFFDLSATLSGMTTETVHVLVRLVTDPSDLGSLVPLDDINFADALPEAPDYSFITPGDEPSSASSASTLTLSIAPSTLDAVARFTFSRDDNDFDNELLWLEIDEVRGAATMGAPSTAAVNILEDVEPPAIADPTIDVEVTGARIRLSWLPAMDTGTETAVPMQTSKYIVFVARRPFEPLSADLRGTQRIAELRRHAEDVANGFAHSVPEARVVEADSQAGSRIAVDLVHERLLPSHDYYVTVAVQDIVGNVALYSSTGTAFATLAAVDGDHNALPDHLVLLGDEPPAGDANRDGIDNALEAYVAQRIVAARGEASGASALSDSNGNGIPDVAEASIGLPVNQETANEAVGDPHRPVITVPEDERNMKVASAGLHTPVHVTVSARDGDADTGDDLQPTAYFRRGALCGARSDDIDPSAAEAAVLPSTYQRACRPVPRRASDGALMLRSGSNRLWWIAVDEDGNWPLGGASSQTIHVLPQVSFQRDHRLPSEAACPSSWRSTASRSSLMARRGGRDVVAEIPRRQR